VSTPRPLLAGLQPRPLLGVARSRSDRVLAGVAGGIADRLRIDPILVRLAAVALAAAGGFGVALYVVAWLLLAEEEPGQPPSARPAPNLQREIGFALVVLGVLVFLRDVGLWFGDSLSWPVALAAFGSAVIWTRTGQRSATATIRVVVGALLVVTGTGAFLDAIGQAANIRAGIVVMVVVTGGLGIVLVPWAWRLARQAGDERRERIRSEERAEVAAHLHDSVLQTLALIQRASGEGEMVALARGQERELRAWLYGRDGRPGAATLEVAINEVAGRVERLHHVPVDVVLVGDAPLDDHTHALVEAAGEAIQNAARHSGADLVSVFVETGPDTVEAFVRDEGKGFNPGEVPTDRRGIAESIVGRMQRHGGRATVTSTPGEGTEVELWLPRE
jgi:signal transduction histidine kinase/phage shock protein PspC (stress-responsive transcriptional regulator)